MGRVLGATYIPGDPWQQCDRCGQTFRSSELKVEWTGLKTCPYDWEPRHPQDFVRGHRDDQAIYNARPVPPPNYVDPIYYPALLTVTTIAEGAILTWELVPNAIDYKLYYDFYDMINGDGSFVLTGNVLSYTITNLVPGRIYYFRLKAVLLNRDTPLSNELKSTAILFSSVILESGAFLLTEFGSKILLEV